MISRKTFAAGGAALASVAIIPHPLRAAEFTWKCGNDLTADHPISVRAVEAFGKIRRDTGGAVDIRLFPTSVLGSDPQMLTQLRSGALEMLQYAGGILDTVVPLASIENVAFAYPSRDAAFAAMDGNLGTLVRRAINDKGIAVLEKVWENGWREFTTSNRPIRTVDDMAGLKIRVSPGKLRVDTFHTLGVQVTPIPPNEVYTALQTHIVDGQETALLFIETARYYEVQKYCSLTNHMWSGYWTLFNMDKWNSLSAAQRAIVAKHVNAAALLQRRDSEILNRSVQEKLTRQGLTINKTDPASFKAKLIAGGYYARWKAEYGDAAWSALEQYTGKLG
ncbi:MAG: TRAP transporter substrate-binding protein [Candidatus Eremiobacteraeota bacterium]|nr:TRAP transporter substrate-binding protein [Candidatus Eremiobacteraeota bacterium]